MGEEACKDCKKWEEELFWTHFRRVHFYRILPADFHQLAIPAKFSSNLKDKLPHHVTLKGPGAGKWEVELCRSDDSIVFNHGWGAFAKAHFLEENDMVVFKYTRNSNFDVLIFDGRTSCEKEAAYFVAKCGHKAHDIVSQVKKKALDSSAEDVPTPPRDLVEEVLEKSPANNLSAPLVNQQSPSNGTNKRSRDEMKDLTLNYVNYDDLMDETLADEIETKPVVERTSSCMTTLLGTSDRKEPTEHEKRTALQMAQTSLTSEGFLVVMRATHVYRKFYMAIPSWWLKKHLWALESQDFLLSTDGRTWRTRFCYQKDHYCSGGLSAGWKNYANDNDLQEFDVCVFEPTGPLHGVFTLEVNVFHAVQH